ncbi:PQQ-dependent sugar dehydrogenase [Iamia majanohamensis]|uniref:PQQ-dependent sugar dehydrogenase n=1 Tax=Iamia majanohamensis TaxID=467976 RepID=A0AAE9Y6D2_9ACTN|nr:PQQ-dependent sugar dehydrogenase [Iamia majanohamensis]WCO67377.1 PQQ-dependent sugar dehydrogenase [Iamia majanohamensis]
MHAPHPGRPRRTARPRRLVAGLAALLLGLTALGGCAPPTLRAQTLVSGLSNPWDLSFTPSGSMIWTERGGRIMRRTSSGAVNQVQADLSDLFASGETGLMGVLVDRRFNSNRRLYTCQGWTDGSRRDVRVIAWQFNTRGDALTRVRTIVSGIPASSGRHGGCRLFMDSSARLYVATGDAAVGTNPQDLRSLGGKVLRVDPDTGAGLSSNPFASSGNANTRKILSYGHRNLQGIAVRPADGTLWTAEHGPDRDDEINRGTTGNFGWNPVPGYNEGVPMTDTAEFPGAVRARWSSGAPTVATSGITWLTGEQWGGWQDRMVVATLKGQSLLVMQPNADGTLTQIDRIYQGTFGRLRTAVLGPDGNLYITTSNGSGDRIIRIIPTPAE